MSSPVRRAIELLRCDDVVRQTRHFGDRQDCVGRPFESRPICTMKSIALAICQRKLDFVLPRKPAKPAKHFKPVQTVRVGELARTVPIRAVVAEVFIACSISITSPPRHSPTMMRSGRILASVLRNRSRIRHRRPRRRNPPGRLSGRTTCGWFSDQFGCVLDRDHALLISGMPEHASALSSEVLPELVPPDTSTLQRAATAAAPRAMPPISGLLGAVARGEDRQDASDLAGTLRIETIGPSIDSGSITTFTRPPSGRRASMHRIRLVQPAPGVNRRAECAPHDAQQMRVVGKAGHLNLRPGCRDATRRARCR